MRPAVRNFEPDRLREAREVRQVSQPSLAEMVGVTRQAISQYETGKSVPSPAVLSKIASCLRFPEHRFVRPSAALAPSTVYYRSLNSATKAARSRAERRLSWLIHDICGLLSEFVVFPRVSFPTPEPPGDPAVLNRRDVERAATAARRHFGLGDRPISDIVLLLENHGAVVVRQELSANKLDAFSTVVGDRPYVVLGSDKASAVRSRFDAAHELGHLVLHRNVPQAIANRPTTHKLMEQQAHYFAGAFLMPAGVFSEEFPGASLDSMVAIKPRWGVSVAAMSRRAFNLGLISENEYRRVQANRLRRWGRCHEPLDDSMPAEQPRFLGRSFDLLLEHGLVSRASIEAETGIFIEDIESAAGLEHGFFGDTVANFRFPTLKHTEPLGMPDTRTPCLPFTARPELAEG